MDFEEFEKLKVETYKLTLTKIAEAIEKNDEKKFLKYLSFLDLTLDELAEICAAAMVFSVDEDIFTGEDKQMKKMICITLFSLLMGYLLRKKEEDKKKNKKEKN